MAKTEWNTFVKTKITVWHEQNLRSMSLSNSKMRYMNVELYGLSGRAHPAVQNILTTQDCKKLRLHLKFLTCDITPYSLISNQACDLCSNTCGDTIEHILVSCQKLSDVRNRLLPELLNTVCQVQPMSDILKNDVSSSLMTQFDCASFNLPDNIRIPINTPRISEIYRVSRDWCFAIGNERTRLLGRLR